MDAATETLRLIRQVERDLAEGQPAPPETARVLAGELNMLALDNNTGDELFVAETLRVGSRVMRLLGA